MIQYLSVRSNQEADGRDLGDPPRADRRDVTYRFTHETFIYAPAEVVFDLARDVEVHVASFPTSRERPVAGVTSGLLGPGDQVTWRATHFGLRWEMTSRITQFDRPRRLVDEQIGGPFAAFHHEHVFIEHDRGVLMRDHVHFRAPAGPLGWLVERAGLGAYLKRLIRQRGRTIQRCAAGRRAGDRSEDPS